MSTGRVYRVGVADVPVTPKGRVYRAGVTGTVPVGPKGRVYRAGITGTAVTAPKGRVYLVQLFGVGAVTVAPIPAMTVEPLDEITIAAVLSTTGDPSWTWRQVSGSPVTLIGTGASRTFTSPASFAGTTVVLGVTATVGGSVSDEMQVTVSVRPQITWIRTHDNPEWRGSKIYL